MCSVRLLGLWSAGLVYVGLRLGSVWSAGIGQVELSGSAILDCSSGPLDIHHMGVKVRAINNTIQLHFPCNGCFPGEPGLVGSHLVFFLNLFQKKTYETSDTFVWARCPSCHPTNSVRAWKKNQRTDPNQEKSSAGLNPSSFKHCETTTNLLHSQPALLPLWQLANDSIQSNDRSAQGINIKDTNNTLDTGRLKEN